MNRPEPQGRGHAEQRGKHCNGINAVPDRPAGMATKQRLATLTDEAGELLAELKIGQAEAHHRVDGPGMQSPVEERIAEGQSRRLGGVARPGRWNMEVMTRFSDTPKNQPDPHARAEEHGEPCYQVKFWLGTVRS